MKTSDESFRARRACARATAIFGIVLCAFAPGSVLANGALFSESFEVYEAGSNLRGQGGWDGLTNQGTSPEMPVTDGDLLTSGKVLNTRAIGQADRIHQIGHALPAFSSGGVTTGNWTTAPAPLPRRRGRSAPDRSENSTRWR